ncbi:MAG: hypothetical protein U7126_24865 [Microcoleus sp.]
MSPNRDFIQKPGFSSPRDRAHKKPGFSNSCCISTEIWLRNPVSHPHAIRPPSEAAMMIVEVAIRPHIKFNFIFSFRHVPLDNAMIVLVAIAPLKRIA